MCSPLPQSMRPNQCWMFQALLFRRFYRRVPEPLCRNASWALNPWPLLSGGHSLASLSLRQQLHPSRRNQRPCPSDTSYLLRNCLISTTF